MKTICVAFVGEWTHDQYWFQVLSDSLSEYGTIKSFLESEIELLDVHVCTTKLVIIDSSSIENIFDVISNIRALLPHSKILVVTASPIWSESREVIYAGANDYCKKSLDKDGILEHVKGLIGNVSKEGHT